MANIPVYTSAVYLASLSALLAFAAWRDVATRTIPDGISIALILVGAAMRLSLGWSSLGTSLLTAAILFVVLLPLCSRGLLGGADLKLITALAVGLAPQASLHLLLAVTSIGGVLAALYLVAGKLLSLRGSARLSTLKARSLVGRIVSVERWRIRRHAPLPYGIAIAIGAAIVVLQQQGV